MRVVSTLDTASASSSSSNVEKSLNKCLVVKASQLKEKVLSSHETSGRKLNDKRKRLQLAHTI